MKNSKIKSMASEIASQNRETARESSTNNRSSIKEGGSARNQNTSGSNCNDKLIKCPNTSQLK